MKTWNTATVVRERFIATNVVKISVFYSKLLEKEQIKPKIVMRKATTKIKVEIWNRMIGCYILQVFYLVPLQRKENRAN